MRGIAFRDQQNADSYVYYINGIINNKKIAQKGSFLLIK